MGILSSRTCNISNLCSCERQGTTEYGDRPTRNPTDMDEKTTATEENEDATTENLPSTQSAQTSAKKINTYELLDDLQSTERLTVIASVSDDEHLEHLILRNYATTPYTDGNESSGSSSKVDEITQNEIMRMKFQESKKQRMTSSNIMRYSSENEWNLTQIDSLEKEMKEELLKLSQETKDVDLNQISQNLSQLSQNIVFSDMDADADDEDELPESNLFRDESEAKWNNPLIAKQKDEMTKQLIHLAKLQKQNSDSKHSPRSRVSSMSKKRQMDHE